MINENMDQSYTIETPHKCLSQYITVMLCQVLGIILT